MSGLVFIGPPGSGKSTVGEAVAKRRRIPFFDLDRMIEETYQVSIETLFKQNKESYFRLLETQCLETFVKRPKPSAYVLATGGGAVVLEKNRMLLKRLGKWVYLKASVETLFERVNGRPIFQGKSEEGLRFLLSQRADYYNEAQWVIEVDRKSTGKVIQEVMGRWEKMIQSEHEK
ncbi:MAG: shikimate kinase [Deltaproteobacteria bacterium]